MSQRWLLEKVISHFILYGITAADWIERESVFALGKYKVWLFLFVFQLRQMLPPPRQISTEQKEDQHQKKHHRPHL